MTASGTRGPDPSPPRRAPITGVEASTAAFVGVTERGDAAPVLVCSFADFLREFGAALAAPAPLLRDRWLGDHVQGGAWWRFAATVQGYFANGGRRLFVKRVVPKPAEGLAAQDFIDAIHALAPVTEASLCAVPGLWASSVQQALVAHCEALEYRFALLDAPIDADVAAVREWRRGFDTPCAALYYPALVTVDAATGGEMPLAASGHVAGIYARVDHAQGVHKAPANETLHGATRLARSLGRVDSEMLDGAGIDTLRFLAGRGCVVWGARTLSSAPQWRYVNVRRLLTFVQRSIGEGTRWTAQEPNGEALWATLRRDVADFLGSLWRKGLLVGERPEQAYFVRCDRSTMTQADIEQGRLVIEIGVAPARPAEFVVIRIGLWTLEHEP